MKIIAICGPIGVGKTTLAQTLEHRRGYTRVSFATPIKIMMETLLLYAGATPKYIDSHLYGAHKDAVCTYLSDKSCRVAMQILGKEFRDAIDRDLYVNIWQRKAAITALNPDAKIVVDDLRFFHEAHMLRKHNATIVKLHRLETTRNTVPEPHGSEVEWHDITPDLEIHNNGLPGDMLEMLALRVAL